MRVRRDCTSLNFQRHRGGYHNHLIQSIENAGPVSRVGWQGYIEYHGKRENRFSGSQTCTTIYLCAPRGSILWQVEKIYACASFYATPVQQREWQGHRQAGSSLFLQFATGCISRFVCWE